ncbi:MAG: hypothetical protein HY908_25980 [Myxococcales bacterium]|nr:hypothetical protein [Myxococcales bacterium]
MSDNVVLSGAEMPWRRLRQVLEVGADTDPRTERLLGATFWAPRALGARDGALVALHARPAARPARRATAPTRSARP